MQLIWSFYEREKKLHIHLKWKQSKKNHWKIMCAITCDYVCVSVCSYPHKTHHFHLDVILNRAHLTERMMKERNQQTRRKTHTCLLRNERKHRNGLAWLSLKWSEVIRLIDWTIECKRMKSLFNRSKCSQLNSHAYIGSCRLQFTRSIFTLQFLLLTKSFLLLF